MMASQAAAIVLVMVCFVVTRLRRNNGQTELITYDPRTEGEQHRQRTLQMIYNINDECLAMLHMTRAPFFLYATSLETEALYLKPLGVLLRSKWQCSYKWLVTTRGLG
jgi:hypothetical protein